MFVLTGRRAAKINLIIYTLGIILIGSCSVLAQEQVDSFPSSEQTFVEIELTSEGVIAFDSAGNPWSWDFNTETFEPGRGIRRGSRDDGRIVEWDGPDDLPIEERATNEMFISGSEKRIVIERDEYFDGDILTSGKVTVKGWVRGNIRSYSRVLVLESGQVDGGIRAPEIIVRTGGLVLGTKYETDHLTDFPVDVFTETVSTAGIWVLFGFAVFLTVAGLLIIVLMPVKLQRMTDCVTHFSARSFFTGLLFTFLMPMVAVLVGITVIGLVVIWAVPLLYLVAYIIGIVIVGRDTGGKLLVKLSGKEPSDVLAYLTGLATLMIIWLVVAVLMGSSDDVSFGFGVFFLVMAILVTCYPIMVGAGAVFLTRFGLRDYVRQKGQFGPVRQEAATPAPPPIPRNHPGFGQNLSNDADSNSGSKPVPPASVKPPDVFPPRSDREETGE